MSGAWTPAERAEVAHALAALPSRLLDLPGGPLTLHRRLQPSELGIGGWLGSRAIFAVDDFTETRDPRARQRLRHLTLDERRRLWLRRAVIHAVLQRWDDARGWSEEPRWRRIAGWLHPFERPLTFRESPRIDFAFAFSRADGAKSASLDLVTFAEEAFVPATAVHPRAVSRDESVRCQELSRWRVLFGFLDEGGLLSPADRARFARGPCPAFDRWADPASLSHVEALFVAASGRAPESLFGHLLLRLVREEGDLVKGPSFDTAVQLVALTGADPPDLRYLMNGVFGGYSLGVMTTTFGDLSHQTRVHEDRSVRRFRLALSKGEQVRFLERVWELERRGYFPYWFFTDNCASLLVFVLEGALDEGRKIDLPPPWSPVLPSAIVDALIDAGVAAPEPGTLLSVRDRAAHAERSREEALATLRSLLPEEDLPRLERAHARAADPRLPVRRTGWSRMADLTRDLAGEDPELTRALYAWWAYTVRIERYAAERAESARLETLLKAIDQDVVHFASADEVVADRQALFQREDELARRLAALDRIAIAQENLRDAPRRPLSSREEALLAEAKRLSAGFGVLTRTFGDLVAARFGDVDPQAFLDGDTGARIASERAWAQRAQVHSGYARFALGGFAQAGGAAGITVASAALDEALGDQRVGGYRASSAIRVLSGQLDLVPRAGLPELPRSRITLLGYRTLSRELASFRSSPLDFLGWGAEWTWERDSARPLPDRSAIAAYALLPLHASARFARFTALGLGARGEVRWAGALRALHLGPELLLLHRLPLGGHAANALRVEVRARRGFQPFGGAFEDEVAATLGLEVRGQLGGRAFLVRPGVALRVHRPRGEDPVTGVRAQVLIEPL